MVDEELILRFFALRDRLAQYRPPLKQFLNDYMAEVRQREDEDELADLAVLFERTASLVAQVLGRAAFRQLDASGQVVDRAPNRALFDAEMLAFSWVRTAPSEVNRQAVVRTIAELFSNLEFQDASTLATGDRSRTLLRVRFMAGALVSAGLDVDPPEVLRPSS